MYYVIRASASVPSLHRESTDSDIHLHSVHEIIFILLYNMYA